MPKSLDDYKELLDIFNYLPVYTIVNKLFWK